MKSLAELGSTLTPTEEIGARGLTFPFPPGVADHCHDLFTCYGAVAFDAYLVRHMRRGPGS